MGVVPLIRDQLEVLRVLESGVVGKEIVLLEILGINALKTVAPAPSAVAGESVVGLRFDGGGRLQLECRQLMIEVDFARTGGIEVSKSLSPWRPEGTRIPPTGRLLLVDGSGVDFKEPGRTKRITFAIREL